MCTELTEQTNDKNTFLARTMDFTIVLDPSAIIVPRNKKWTSQLGGPQHAIPLAYLGIGQIFANGQCLFADGVNEKGVACAALYFPGYAQYHEKADSASTNLAPHEVVGYLLGNAKSIEDAIDLLKNLRIVSSPVEQFGIITPLHWIVSDKTGRCIVAEPGESGMEIHENPFGVMTNSPDFNWHTTNLRNYISLRPKQLVEVTLAGVPLNPFSQGSGTFGLPGDHTPPARFVRTVFAKQMSPAAESETDGINNILHALSGVDVPKGSVLTLDEAIDYTQYTSILNTSTSCIYFKTYDNYQLRCVRLSDADLDGKEISHWKINTPQEIQYLKNN